MTNASNTAPTETGIGSDSCASPVAEGVDPSSTPASLEWLAAAMNAAMREYYAHEHDSNGARDIALATCRASMRAALRMVMAGDARADIRDELALSLLVAGGYLGEMNAAADMIAAYHARYAGAWQRNSLSGECDCSGDRDRIPVWRSRCAGCGAVLQATALGNREVVRW